MGDIRAITVHLVTSDLRDAGTDDVVYLGFFGTGGGQEFPLIVTHFDDYADGSVVDYHLGTDTWVVSTDGTDKTVDRSNPGAVNDPAQLPVDLDTVQYVYIRKAGDGRLHGQSAAGPPADEGDDDAWLMESADVYLGDATRFRKFSTQPRKPGLWFGNEFGHAVYLQEVDGFTLRDGAVQRGQTG